MSRIITALIMLVALTLTACSKEKAGDTTSQVYASDFEARNTGAPTATTTWFGGVMVTVRRASRESVQVKWHRTSTRPDDKVLVQAKPLTEEWQEYQLVPAMGTNGLGTIVMEIHSGSEKNICQVWMSTEIASSGMTVGCRQ
jgi:hypothetical protein